MIFLNLMKQNIHNKSIVDNAKAHIKKCIIKLDIKDLFDNSHYDQVFIIFNY